MAEQLIPVMRGAVRLFVHPSTLAAHMRVGWVVDETPPEEKEVKAEAKAEAEEKPAKKSGK